MNGTENGSACIRHDWSESDYISTTVVLAVSELAEVSVDELAPLSGVVRPDALDDLLRPDGAAVCGGGSVSVSFEYEGYRVTARRDGSIELRPSDGC